MQIFIVTNWYNSGKLYLSVKGDILIKRLILILLLICFFCLNSNLDKAFASASSEEMLIILDYSASMNKPLNDKTRARYVLLTLFTALSNIPDDTKIGLRVFGPDNNYQASMARDIHTNHDCKATYLKVPIASNSKHLIYARLSEYTNPFGQTPIELSLRQAIQNDFSEYTLFLNTLEIILNHNVFC